jgi:hypothetical protein
MDPDRLRQSEWFGGQWIPVMPEQTQLEAPDPLAQIRLATASCSALLAW